jgi:hypothetical protein
VDEAHEIPDEVADLFEGARGVRDAARTKAHDYFEASK